MKKVQFLIVLILHIVSCGTEEDASDPKSSIVQTPPNNTATVPTPGQSSLSAPANNEVCLEGQEVDATNSSVTFSWNASTDTDSYDLVITNQKTNSSQTEAGITSTSKEVTLENDLSYSWKIISKANDTSDTSTSEVWQFYLAGDGQENHTPFAATVLNPLAGTAVDATDSSIGLSWEGNDPDADDTLSYTIYFGETNPPQETIAEDVSETSKEVPVESGKTYYWRIKTTDGINSSFTLVYSFLVN